MVPGFTDTDCRIAEFRSRDLRGTAERQRIAALVHPARPERTALIATLRRSVDALAPRMVARLQRTAPAKRADAPSRIAALGATR